MWTKQLDKPRKARIKKQGTRTSVECGKETVLGKPLTRMYLGICVPSWGLDALVRVGWGVECTFSCFWYVKVGRVVKGYHLSREPHFQLMHRNFLYIRNRLRKDWGVLLCWEGLGVEIWGAAHRRVVGEFVMRVFADIRNNFP